MELPVRTYSLQSKAPERRAGSCDGRPLALGVRPWPGDARLTPTTLGIIVGFVPDPEAPQASATIGEEDGPGQDLTSPISLPAALWLDITRVPVTDGLGTYFGESERRAQRRRNFPLDNPHARSAQHRAPSNLAPQLAKTTSRARGRRTLHPFFLWLRI